MEVAEQAFQRSKNTHEPASPAVPAPASPAPAPPAPPASLGSMFAQTLPVLGDYEGAFTGGLEKEGAGSGVTATQTTTAGGKEKEEPGGFLGSLPEPAGSLMSAGGGSWSISTLPGEEGLLYSAGVKTEEVFDEWASSGGGRQQARMADFLLQPSPLLAAAAGGLKSDTEEGWNDFVGPPPPICGTTLPNCSGKAGSDANLRPAQGKGTTKPSAARPTTLAPHSAGSSTKDNIDAFSRQRSSSRRPATLTPATAVATQAAPACATTTTKTAPPPCATATTAATAPAAPAAPPGTAAATAVPTRTRSRARTAAAAAAAAAAATATAVTTATTTTPGVKLELAQEDDDEEENGDECPATATATATAKATATTRKTAAVNSAHIKSDSDDDFDELDLDDPAGSELTDKRRRNREHAKRSRLRKRVRLGGLEEMVLGLRRENVRLRRIVMHGIPDRAAAIIRNCAKDNTNADTVAKQDVIQGMRPGMSLGSSASSWSARGGSRIRPKLEAGTDGGPGASSSSGSGKSSGAGKDRRVPSALKLMSPCYQTVKALTDSQANFILTNPNLPDCPIIFASQGFLELTGYDGKDVIGKNCRFLQGPGTDPGTLSMIRNNVAAGRDTSVCILNYKKDGTPFWNQLSIGVLLDSHGQVANHVGVVYEVSPMPPALFHRLLHRVPLPDSLLNIDSGSDGEDDVVERSKSSAADTGHRSGANGGGAGSSAATSGDGSVATSRSSAAPAPRVVDRLRRTRAAAAISDAAAVSKGSAAT